MKLLDVFGKLSKKSITYMILIAKLTNYRFKYSLSGTFFIFHILALNSSFTFSLKCLRIHIFILYFTSSYLFSSQLQFLHLESHYLKCNILLSVLKHNSEISSKPYYSIVSLYKIHLYTDNQILTLNHLLPCLLKINL